MRTMILLFIFITALTGCSSEYATNGNDDSVVGKYVALNDSFIELYDTNECFYESQIFIRHFEYFDCSYNVLGNTIRVVARHEDLDDDFHNEEFIILENGNIKIEQGSREPKIFYKQK